MTRLEQVRALIGEHVSMRWKGRDLLGTVTAVDNDVDGIRIRVRHFNGEPWPVVPWATSVEVIGDTK